MRGPTLDLSTRILKIISKSDPQKVWTQADFAKLASRDAIDKALQRLAATGQVRRIDRGLYDQIRINPITKKPVPADYRQVIDAIARRDQTRMLVDGMTAANDLGLSDAVPGQVIVHSDARLKPLNLGNLTITFRPTSASKLYWAGRPGMRLVQALYWLKSKLDDPNERPRVIKRIKYQLSLPKAGTALRKDLLKGLPSLPAWMQDFLRPLLGSEAHVKRSQRSREKTSA